MLVLSRMRAESIYLDFSNVDARDLELLRAKPVRVDVVDIRGDKVRLGFDAPELIGVHRKEVYDAMRREGRTMRRKRVEVPRAVAEGSSCTPG